jgi:hypothetical protein
LADAASKNLAAHEQTGNIVDKYWLRRWRTISTGPQRLAGQLSHWDIFPAKPKTQYNKLSGEKMLDLLISLAFSMQSNKGAYALLLDAGVSRSSRIPAG